MSMRRAFGLISVIVLLSGCAPTATITPATLAAPTLGPSAPPTAVEVDWQMADAPIDRDNIFRVQRLGWLAAPESPPNTVFSLAVALSQTAVTALDSSSVMVWDLLSGALVMFASGQEATQVYYAPERASVYTLTADGLLREISIQTGQTVRTLVLTSAFGGSSAYDPLNGWLAVSAPDGSWNLWDVPLNEQIGEQAGTGTPVSALAFDAIGAHLAVSDRNGTVQVWRVPSMERLWQVDLLSPVTRLAFSAAGHLLIKSEDGVTMLDAAEGTLVAPLTDSRLDSTFIVLEQAGIVLLSATGTSALSVFDPSSGAALGQIDVASTDRLSALENADGTLIATIAPGSPLIVWAQSQGGTWETVRLLETQSNILRAVWTADGYQIVLFGTDGRAEVWGVPAG